MRSQEAKRSRRQEVALKLCFFAWLLGLLASWPLTAQADNPRLHALYSQIRCVVCQAESIDESPSLLAEDMRAFVRGAVQAGQSDAAILSSLQERYGDKVLMKPPVRTDTLILWLAPFLLLISGIYIWARKKAN